jgi:peptide alpha-N-acetyltransferase
MEATNSDAHGPTASSPIKKTGASGKGDVQITCCQKDSAGSSCQYNGKENSVEISKELRDRLCLKSVNGLIVNGLDTHKTINPSPKACGKSSSQNSSGTSNVDSVSDIATYNSEESSGYSSSHEESRLSKVQRQAEDNGAVDSAGSDIRYVSYESELQMPDIMHLIQKDLSEPYSIYTYRYFIHNWPKLCFLVSSDESLIWF